MKPTYLWKSLTKGHKSSRNDFHWVLNKWYKHNSELFMCESGFHASHFIVDAMYYVSCDSLALVEVRGKHLEQDDKECWSEMRVVKFYKWKKLYSVMLAVFAAREVLDIFEKEYPTDDRPRKAIEAAEAYILNPTKKNAAADAADAADVAAYAADAADDVHAAYTAHAAAYAASAAAFAATHATSAAADAADAADVAADAADAAYAARAAAFAATHATSAAADAADAADVAAYATDKKIKQQCQEYIYKLIGYKDEKI